MHLTTNDRRSYLLGLQIAGDFGASIAVPVILFVVIGKWAQEKFGHAPFGVIVGFICAATISTMIIRRKATQYGRAYAALEAQKKRTTDRHTNDARAPDHNDHTKTSL